ncbi:guanine deaminase [Romboutsia weinsteinii]|uniref:Guanine deaminase n=1 Tax=Romboutsia weinsteinii TaxID=2020949 RepID=A0A371J486_9FIRM|nr:guanine deaminase [Romboutsia weinsteinii]RDY27601.1 guanine deaminase [Romboutsia weinsteinii]
MKGLKILKGNIIFTKDPNSFVTLENGYIVVKDSKVLGTYSSLPEEFKNLEIIDYKDKLIIPGFVDLHAHAPQFENRGIGLDRELIPWLETYTFVEEDKFKDTDYAKDVYSRLANSLKENGTTSVVLFSSIHKESTKVLFDTMHKVGISGFIGKVNMDRNCPDYLKEDTSKSIEDTIELVKEYSKKYPLVKPIITPRFIPTCSDEILLKLGEITTEYDLKVQSHLSENKSEIDWVSKLHPNTNGYGMVYDKFGLFKPQSTIMAHCVYSDKDEINLLKEKGVFVAHCPGSNTNLSSGIAPIKEMMDSGLNVGLGSDISGGHDLSMTKVMVLAVQLSKMKWLENNRKGSFLSTSNVFYLATKGGGSFFGDIGSFERNYDFDALIIDDSNLTNLDLSLEERLQKFIYIGDDRNIVNIYVKGSKIK